MLLHNQTRPYEKEAGASRKLVDDWTKKLTDMFAKEKGYSAKEMETILPQIAEAFFTVHSDPSHHTIQHVNGQNRLLEL